MGQPEWTPANVVERDMADALARGDSAEYARLLRSTRLVVPELPSPGSEQEAELAELLPPHAPYVPVFTSPESLAWGFGDLVEAYHELDFPALLQRWPGWEHLLAVNPGSPIAAFLPPHALADLAEGKQTLVSTDDIEQVVADETLGQIRRLCLAELAGRSAAETEADWPPAVADELPPLRDDPPANALETALLAAVDATDDEAYLQALLGGDPLILPTAAPVDDPEDIFDDDFPWRVLGGEQAQVIAIFTSREMLARTGAGGAPHTEVDLLHVLVNWPSEEHLLCVNPGSVLEVMLPGEVVLEVVASMADRLDLRE